MWCVVFCCGVYVVVLCGVLLCGVVVCDVVVFLHGSVSCCVSCDSASQSWVYSAVDLLFRPVESCSTWFRGDVHAWYSFVGIACFYSFAGVGVSAGTVFFCFRMGVRVGVICPDRCLCNRRYNVNRCLPSAVVGRIFILHRGAVLPRPRPPPQTKLFSCFFCFCRFQCLEKRFASAFSVCSVP